MNLVGPIAFFIFGFIIIIDPTMSLRHGSVYLDFTMVKWIVGPIFIVVGAYWQYTNQKIRVKNKHGKREKINNLICPKCKQAYPVVKDIHIKKCPKCQLNLLTLEKFLEHVKLK